MESDHYFGHAGDHATPAYRRSVETPYIGNALTIGNVAKIADIAATARALIAKTDADLADIERRIERLERQRADEALPRRTVSDSRS